MAWSKLYDGIVSGTTILAATGTTDAGSCFAIPYANGQRVLIMYDGSA